MDSKDLSFEQYLYYRHRYEGYQSLTSPNGGEMLTSWMQEKNRNNLHYDIPTIELQSATFRRGEGLVLCKSLYITKLLVRDGGQESQVDTRPSGYTHYLMLSFDGENAGQQVESALRALAKEDLLIGHREISDIINSEDRVQLQSKFVSAAEIDRDWKQFRLQAANTSLSEENLAAFLSRYWEVCWNRLTGEKFTPITVIATGKERWDERPGQTVFPDGVIFFHDKVLSHLPDPVKEIVSISFAGVYEEAAAQPGTACMVCCLTKGAMNAEILYDAANNEVYDDDLNDIYIKIGRYMLSAADPNSGMPEAYKRVRELEGGAQIVQDFELTYKIAEIENALDVVEGEAVDAEKAAKYLKLAYLKALPGINQYLADYKIGENDIFHILCNLEERILTDCLKKVDSFDAELYRAWIDQIGAIDRRAGKKYAQEAESLKEKYRALIGKTFSDLSYNESALLYLCGGEINDENANLISLVANNGQKYTDDLRLLPDVCRVLLDTQAAYSLKGYEAAAAELEKKLLQVSEPLRENLSWNVSPISFISAYGYNKCTSRLLSELISNGQLYDGLLTPQNERTVRALCGAQAAARLNGDKKLADDMMEFILDHAEQSEKLINVPFYLSQYNNEPSLADREVFQSVLGDVSVLLKRHGMYVTQYEPIIDARDALNELAGENSMLELLRNPPLKLTDEQLSQIMRDTEMILPAWYAQTDVEFDSQLYTGLLGRAQQFFKRGGDDGELARAYEAFALKDYSNMDTDACALSCFIENDTQALPREWDVELCRAAEREPYKPCASGKLVEHIFELRNGHFDEAADEYMRLLAVLYSDENVPLLEKYLGILDAGKSRRADREAQARMVNDIKELLDRLNGVSDTLKEEGKAALDGAEKIGSSTMRKLAEWYAHQKSICNEGILNSIEDTFTNALKHAASDGNDRTELTNLYCDTAILYKNNLFGFWNELIEQLDQTQLSDLKLDNPVIPAVRIYLQHDGRRKMEVKSRITRVFEEKHENHTITSADIKSLIDINKDLGLDKCGSDICAMLEAISDTELTGDVLETLCGYAASHRDEADIIFEQLRARCLGAEGKQVKEQRVNDILTYTRESYAEPSLRARKLQVILNDCMPCLEGMPREAIMNSLTQEVASAKNHLGNIKGDIMRWYDNIEASEQELMPHMKKLREELEISSMDPDAQSPRWKAFFMEMYIEQLCEEIDSKPMSLKDMIGLAQSEGTVRDVMRQTQLLSESGNAEAIARGREKLKESELAAIRRDTTLKDVEVLSKEATRANELNGLNQYDLFTKTLKESMNEYMGSAILSDDGFNALTRDEKSIRALSAGLAGVNDGEIEKKKEALSAACALMDYYKAVAQAKNTPSELKSMISEMPKVKGQGRLSEVCFDIGRDYTKNVSAFNRTIPYMLSSVNGMEGSAQVEWMQYLNGALPLGEAGDWGEVNIWRDDSNAFGKLAAVFEWLSQPGLEELRESFSQYIDATDIGKNARKKKDISKFMKHCDAQTASPMLKWLMGAK